MLVLAIWLVLVFARGGFWRCRDRDDLSDPPAPSRNWPGVVGVVPARDEADVIAQSVGSLLAQDYPGEFRIVLVDDQSGDGTAAGARTRRPPRPIADRLTVLAGAPLPPGWTGKALGDGAGRTLRAREHSRRNICCSPTPTSPTRPTTCARWSRGRKRAASALVSLMALLRCDSAAEKLLIPAFVYFFQMLYPFRWVSRPAQKDRRARRAAACWCAPTCWQRPAASRRSPTR